MESFLPEQALNIDRHANKTEPFARKKENKQFIVVIAAVIIRNLRLAAQVQSFIAY